MIVDFDQFLVGKCPYDLKVKLDNLIFSNYLNLLMLTIRYKFTILFFFCRFSKMPCCCKNNVQASFVIGIVLAVLCLIGIAGDFSPLGIVLGIIGALIHCIVSSSLVPINAIALLYSVGSKPFFPFVLSVIFG